MATKKAADPHKEKKKLLITAIKKTIQRNGVLPILEDVLFTGKEAIVTDLENSVVIPFESANSCIPANKVIDCLEMMDKPDFKLVRTETHIPIPEHFIVDDVIYDGNLDEAKLRYQKYLNSKVGEEEEETLSWSKWCDNNMLMLTKDLISQQPPIVSNYIEVSEGKRVIKLTGDDPDNFPITPMLDKEHPVIGCLTKEDLEKIETALSFVSTDDLRPAMTGILIGKKIVSTDAHRMYFDDLSTGVTREFILPAKAAKILLALGGETWQLTTKEEYEMKDDKIVLKQATIKEMRVPKYFILDGVAYKGELEMAEMQYKNYNNLDPTEAISEELKEDFVNHVKYRYRNSIIEDIENIEMEEVEVPDPQSLPAPVLLGVNYVCFTRPDGVKLITRAIDARYPQYQVVIPSDEPNSVVTVNPDEMLKELKNASKFANKSTNQVAFGVNRKLTIEAQEIDFGEQYNNEFELAEIEHKSGDGFKIAFNAKFLNEIVSKEKDKPIVMNLWTPTKCAIINDHFLVMPLMLNSAE